MKYYLLGGREGERVRERERERERGGGGEAQEASKVWSRKFAKARCYATKRPSFYTQLRISFWNVESY